MAIFIQIWPYWPYLIISLMTKTMAMMGIPGKITKKTNSPVKKSIDMDVQVKSNGQKMDFNF